MGKSKYHFIEIMGCPGGCINGGGQPYVREAFLPNEDDDIMDTYIQKRANALYSEELATFGADNVYNQADAAGFINLYGLPIKVQAQVAQANGIE